VAEPVGPRAGAVPIWSRRHWNETGIRLTGARTCRLTATGIWYDAWIRTGPDGYQSGNCLQRWSERLRRAPSEDWFVLMGAIDCDPSTIFRIGTCAVVTPPRDGQLTCFANDVPGMYWNNRGAVHLIVSDY